MPFSVDVQANNAYASLLTLDLFKRLEFWSPVSAWLVGWFHLNTHAHALPYDVAAVWHILRLNATRGWRHRARNDGFCEPSILVGWYTGLTRTRGVPQALVPGFAVAIAVIPTCIPPAAHSATPARCPLLFAPTAYHHVVVRIRLNSYGLPPQHLCSPLPFPPR